MEAIKEFIKDVETADREVNVKVEPENFEYVYKQLVSVLNYPVDTEVKTAITKFHSIFKTVVENFPRISDKNFILAMLITQFFTQQYKTKKRKIIKDGLQFFFGIVILLAGFAHLVLFIPVRFREMFQNFIFQRLPDWTGMKLMELKNYIVQKGIFLYDSVINGAVNKHFFWELFLFLIVWLIIMFTVSKVMKFLVENIFLNSLLFSYLFIVIRFMNSSHYSLIIIAYCVVIFGTITYFITVSTLKEEKVRLFYTIYDYIKSFI